MIKNKKNANATTILPIIIFIIVLVGMSILTKGNLLTLINLQAILEQSLVTIIAGLGLIFVISMGGTDITSGVIVGLAGTAFGVLTTSVNFGVGIIVCLLIGAATGVILGITNAYFKVPSFMVSIALLIAMRAGITWWHEELIFIPNQMLRVLDNLAIKVPLAIILIIITAYVFHYTKFGYYVRAIGENENATIFLGIDVKKIKTIAFVISGFAAGIAALLSVSRIGGANQSLGIGFEMRVMMAIFIGGVPVSGGMDSKIFKIILGAFMTQILENGLVLMGVSGATTQLIRGILLVIVVFSTLYFQKVQIARTEMKLVKEI